MNRKLFTFLHFYLFAFFLFYLYQPVPMAAQGLLTEIKVIAVQDYDDLAAQAGGYTGTGSASLDFRKGKGGGAVFAIFKNGTDTTKYITDVVVTADKGSQYGMKFSEDGKDYTPAVFYQESEHHYDKSYRGGLNGRDYWCYGGAYSGQPHVYVSRTGNTDFSKKVLKEAYVTTSKPKDLPADATWKGGYAGGGRYFVFRWHTHEPKFRAIDDINWHERYCDLDQCGITKTEPHRFYKRYGLDTWLQLAKSDQKAEKSHYKQCMDCGQIVYGDHSWATFVSDGTSHTKRCLICDYVEQADHVNFGKQKIPVDENYHIIYCDSCGFLRKFPHEYGENRVEKSKDCESTIVEYRCKHCYHVAYFEEPGVGHDYDAYGICRRKNCLHPYEQPAVEPFGNGDSIYVVKSFGNLYWVSDYVNNRRPKTNIRIADDINAENFMKLPWHPIGATDSTAFQGTFDGGGHVISMLQTEEPVAGCGYRGLFGAVGKDATVKNVTLASCNMSGWNNIGAVAGVNEGTIEGCHVLFSVMKSIGTGMNIGGICGLNKGVITGCLTESSVWVGGVRDYAGGICGTNAGGRLAGNTSQAICGSGSDAVLPESASQQ